MREAIHDGRYVAIDIYGHSTIKSRSCIARIVRAELEPVASDQLSRPRSPLDRISAASSSRPRYTSFCKLFRSHSCAICFRIQSGTAINPEPAEVDCNLRARRYNFNPEYVSNLQTNSRRRRSRRCCSVTGLSILEVRARITSQRVRGWVQVRATKGPGAPCQIDHTSATSKPNPRCERDNLAPQSVSPAWMRNAFAPPLPIASVPTQTYIRTHAAGTPCALDMLQ